MTQTSEAKHARRNVVAATLAVFGVLALLVLITLAIQGEQELARENRAPAVEDGSAGIPPVVGSEDDDHQVRTEPSEGDEEPWGIWRSAESALAGLTLLLVVGTGVLAAVTAALVADARRSSERQLRAYISIAHAEVTLKPSSNGKHLASSSVSFCNFGKTPAYNLRTRAFFKLLPWNEPTFDALDEPHSMSSRATIGPSAERTRHETIDEICLADIDGTLSAPSEKMLITWGGIFYEDTFGGKRHTYFKVFLGGTVGPSNGVPAEGGGITYKMKTYWDGNNAT